MTNDVLVLDEPLLEADQVCEILGRPGKPLSRKTLSRYEQQPDGLAYVDLAGRHAYTPKFVRAFVTAREHRPPSRRKP